LVSKFGVSSPRTFCGACFPKRYASGKLGERPCFPHIEANANSLDMKYSLQCLLLLVP
jgi:hypothetical protein